ncbi:response regulator, partial [Hymenobacter coccineus]|uniref:response regulator n=1 Tax=Hymenobacter coccineus TaxID=1908235 RepID=UPI000A6F04AD
MIRLFLVDDHSIVRNGLRALLAAEADLVVVGEASHGQELLDCLPATPADVVLLDLAMPVLDGLATTTRLRAEYPALHVLVLTMEAEPQRIGELFEAGARGYLLKNAGQIELLTAIRAVAAGEQYLCSELGMSLLHQVLAFAPAAQGPQRQVPALGVLAQV